MQPQRIIPVVCPHCSHTFDVDTFAYRFWVLVDRSGGPDACWPWLGNIAPNGYGQVTVGSRADDSKRTMGSHRVAYELGNGPIPDGMHVCHRCDFRPCCNPAHLFPGTVTENMRDMVAKGRQGKKARSACRRGHDMTDPANVMLWFDAARGQQRRKCRACNATNAAEWRENLAPEQRAAYLAQLRTNSRAWHAAHRGYIQPNGRKDHEGTP